MIVLEFGELKIEITAVKNYPLINDDYSEHYDFQLSLLPELKSRYLDIVPKFGVYLKSQDKVLKSALFISNECGLPKPDEQSALIDGENLILIIGDAIISFSIPAFRPNWVLKCGHCVTCFGLYQVDDGYVVHGELSIIKVDKFGQIEWEFSGRDIFVTAEGMGVFRMEGNLIYITDWEYNKYILDMHGNLIESIP